MMSQSERYSPLLKLKYIEISEGMRKHADIFPQVQLTLKRAMSFQHYEKSQERRGLSHNVSEQIATYQKRGKGIPHRYT